MWCLLSPKDTFKALLLVWDFSALFLQNLHHKQIRANVCGWGPSIAPPPNYRQWSHMTSKCCRGSEYSYAQTTTCTECNRYRQSTRICASKLFLLGVQFFLTGSVQGNRDSSHIQGTMLRILSGTCFASLLRDLFALNVSFEIQFYSLRFFFCERVALKNPAAFPSLIPSITLNPFTACSLPFVCALYLYCVATEWDIIDATASLSCRPNWQLTAVAAALREAEAVGISIPYFSPSFMACLERWSIGAPSLLVKKRGLSPRSGLMICR